MSGGPMAGWRGAVQGFGLKAMLPCLGRGVVVDIRLYQPGIPFMNHGGQT